MSEFVPSIKVIFYIAADEFDLDEVTCRLGVIPTETRTKDSFPPQGLAHTMWCVEIKQENCCAIEIIFEKVIGMLHGKAPLIRELCNDYGLETGFVVVIHMKDGDSPEVVLPREVVSFAASINAEIGFDLYCYE